MTWKNEVTTWLGVWAGETVSRPRLEVTTWSEKRCRDTNLMSRHGLGFRRSLPENEVATWPGAGQGREVTTCAHDLGATRPTYARCARDLCWLCQRRAHDQSVVRAAAPTTRALRAQCARNLVSGCAHCAHNPVLRQCTV